MSPAGRSVLQTQALGEYQRFYLPAPLAAPPRKHGTLINIGGRISHPVAGPNQSETNIEGFVSRLRGCYGAHLGS